MIGSHNLVVVVSRPQILGARYFSCFWCLYTWGYFTTNLTVEQLNVSGVSTFSGQVNISDTNIVLGESTLAQIITELNSQPLKYSKTMQVLKLLVEQVELILGVMVQIPGQM